MRGKLMMRCRALSIFWCSLLSLLLIFGCGGESDSGNGGASGGGSSGENVPPPSVPATAVTLQGKVDDGLPHSPIANAVCRFTDRNGTQLATTTADTNGLFQLAVPLDVHGFLRCAPPALSNLRLSAFVSTVGRQAGDTITNLVVTPATTLVADILATTNPPDIQARATTLANTLAAGDADLALLADAETTLYNAQLANRLNVDFSGGSEGSDSGDSGGGGSDGAGAAGGDSGGT